MTSGWAAFVVGTAVYLIAAGLFFGVLKGKIDALGARIDEVQKDIRELRSLIMGKQDK
jgi:hypothetical protein